MRARFRGQPFYRIEIHHQELCKLRQREWIQGLITVDAGKITQAQRAQLELFSFFRGRQEKLLHLTIITQEPDVGTRRQV